MQYNQPYCGNGYTNGPVYNFNNNPRLPYNTGMCPDVVGEGEVTSVTLPDGTVQFFFMPTVKWWAPNPYQPNIPNNNYTNPNMNGPPPWNTNVGTWFVRSITNPLPQNTFSTPCQRYEVPRPCYNSDCNMNTCNNGYQLKFHNDDWTSTTDIGYFYPALRQQRDSVPKQTCKGNASVQVDTEPPTKTVCRNDIICPYPCKCNDVPQSMSLVSLVEHKSKNFSESDDGSSDGAKKKRRNKRNKKVKEKKSKSKIVSCACESTEKIITANKSVITYSDMGCSCAPAGGRETQTLELNKQTDSGSRKTIPMFKADTVLQRCQVRKAETWHPVTSFSKKSMEANSNNLNIHDIIYISDNEYNGGCSSNCSCCSN